MSSAGRAPHPAFVEEYDEDAEVTLPDTRQDASVSTRTPGINTRPDSRYESSELSIIIHDDDLLSDVSGPGRSPPVQGIYEDTVLTTSNQSRRPLSIASEVEPVRIHARRRPTETRPYLNPRSEYSSFVSSPTGPVVGPSHAGNWNTASYPKIPRLRNTTGGNGSLRAQGTADAPHRRRHRRRRFPSYEPQSYRPPSYVPSQPYEYPGYTTYYPSDYLTPYAAQNPFAPAPLFGSPYRTPYYHPNQGIGLQSHGAEVSTSAGGPSRASEQPSETGPGPQTERPGTRPVHRFINLRRLKTDLEDKHAGFETHNAAILTYDQTEDGDRRFETRWMHYTSDTMELRSFMKFYD
ncbi:uncharacterized protein BDV17DRAFT_3095 [Aspergillus undulatus]|uniref:uncharacterized protein n=1 Tax=Aspergillus undulatus TaxID=1810928 RepID=UPI003CCE3582